MSGQNRCSPVEPVLSSTATSTEHPVLDSGYLSLLGHRLLGAVSVVAGACETLACDDGRISAANRILLERAIERNLLEIANGARSLVHGEVALP